MKVQLLCYIHRSKFGEVEIKNPQPRIPIAYDFCPSCAKRMVQEFERQFTRTSIEIR